MCAVGEKLIQFPDNCGVGSYKVARRDETHEYKYPEIIEKELEEIDAWERQMRAHRARDNAPTYNDSDPTSNAHAYTYGKAPTCNKTTSCKN